MNTVALKSLVVLFVWAVVGTASASTVTSLHADYRNGQVFLTWDRLLPTDPAYHYHAYRSPNPIISAVDLPSAEYLGSVRHNSSENVRVTNIRGGAVSYLRIDSSSAKLDSSKGLFVATSTINGPQYYAVVLSIGLTLDSTIIVGENALSIPVNEVVAPPQPVWQDSWTMGPNVVLHYVQFATTVTSPLYPLMTNVGSYPFNFELITGSGPGPHPLTVWLHPGGGHFMQAPGGLGVPGEWVLSIDDELPNAADFYTMFYGFHKGYDIYSSSNPVPTADTIFDYTSARVIHTITWCQQHLPVDAPRTYLTGFSLGAIGALFTAMTIPSKIAAIAIYSPKVNFAQPFETNIWDELITERLYGTPASDLPTNEGLTRNERLNANVLADLNRTGSLPVLYTFCGKNDYDVDWAEKVEFYATLERDAHGGFHFWGPGDHGGTAYNSPWRTTFPDFSFFAKYSTDKSYPAFSSCSINSSPGNGARTEGDSLGTINGFLDWSDDIVDTTDRWECTLLVRDLQTVYGPLTAPDSVAATVTLRRLQHFTIPSGARLRWETLSNDQPVQDGICMPDDGRITIQDLKIFKSAGRLRVVPAETTIQIPVAARWNLVSDPFHPSNDSVSIRFPAGASPAYAFQPLAGYQSELRMRPGAGYWLKFGAAESVLLSGVGRYRDTVDLAEGWNLIGSLALPVDAASITFEPDPAVVSKFFTYTGSYTDVDTLMPGRAYWIKVDRACKAIREAK